MKRKIRIPIAFVLLSAASLMILLGAPNTQQTNSPQTEPEVSVRSTVSTSTDNGGMRTLADTVLPSMRYGSHIDLNQPSLTLDRLDIRSLALDDNQIGVNRSVAVSPNTRAQKFVNPDGSEIIVLIIKSSGASGIGVHFRDFALADGEEVYVYGTAPDSIVSGPFTDKGPWGDGEFWSDTVDGDTAVIEFYKKPNGRGRGFEIFEISHILAELDWRLWSNEPEVLNCEVDASCNLVVENNAVARIVYNNNGDHVCTGTLLKDLPQDKCPYFLTANHCVPNCAVARTVKVYWFYQTTSCRSGVLRPGGPRPLSWYSPPSPDTVLLETQSSNDFSLLRLAGNAPTGAKFAGWTAAAQPTGTVVFGLHHPDGYVPPQIPSYLRRSDGSITSTTNVSCQRTGLANGYRVDWTSGAIEGGSSGSGLFTSTDHKLVGVLSCRPAPSEPPCSYGLYSKFSNFYPQIRQYIDSLTPAPPIATPATLLTSCTFKANWKRACSATGYRLDVSTSDQFYTYVTGYHDLDVGDALSHRVTGLNTGTRYYYRVRAYNANGTSGNSNVVNVATAPGPPVVTTNPANLITTFSARLHGTVDPNGLPTTVYFQYGYSTSYGSTTASQTKTGCTDQNVSANISSLGACSTIHFRIVASNSAGTSYGSDKTFVTSNYTPYEGRYEGFWSGEACCNGEPCSIPPTAISFVVSSSTVEFYGLHGPVDSNGHFDAFDTFCTVDQHFIGSIALNGHASGIYTGAASPCCPGINLTWYADRQPPVVVTNAATIVTASSAELHGTVDPRFNCTDVRFQYGTTSSYGSTTSSEGFLYIYSDVIADISGLRPSTTYHFRIVGTNSAGTSYGADRTFTTPP